MNIEKIAAGEHLRVVEHVFAVVDSIVHTVGHVVDGKDCFVLGQSSVQSGQVDRVQIFEPIDLAIQLQRRATESCCAARQKFVYLLDRDLAFSFKPARLRSKTKQTIESSLYK